MRLTQKATKIADSQNCVRTWCERGNEIQYKSGKEEVTADVVNRGSFSCDIRVKGNVETRSLAYSVLKCTPLCERLRLLIKGLKFNGLDNERCWYTTNDIIVLFHHRINAAQKFSIEDLSAGVEKSRMTALCSNFGAVHFKEGQVMISDQTSDSEACSFVLYRKEKNGYFSKKTVPSTELVFDDSGISFDRTWGASAVAETVENPFHWCKEGNVVSYHFQGKEHLGTVRKEAAIDGNCYVKEQGNRKRKYINIYLPVRIQESPAAGTQKTGGL